MRDGPLTQLFHILLWLPITSETLHNPRSDVQILRVLARSYHPASVTSSKKLALMTFLKVAPPPGDIPFPSP